MGAREFVEDNASVHQVAVNITNMEVGVAGLPTWTPINQEVDVRGHLREGQPVLIFCKYRQ